jgi:phosphoserine phosphatase
MRWGPYILPKYMSGTGVRILLARHGETVFNVERRYQGHSDSPLTERGVAQARELAHSLKDEPVAAVYASDLGRAFETALVVAVPHGLQVIADPRLREIDVGDWTGLSAAEVKATDGERQEAWRTWPATVRMPRGEALGEVQARALEFFSVRMHDHAGQTVVVIAHGAISQAILINGMGGAIADLWLPNWLANCQVATLDCTHWPARRTHPAARSTNRLHGAGHGRRRD